MPFSFINRLKATVPGAMVYSIFAGSIGAVILVVFFNGIFSAELISKLIPWIFCFNAAITGYTLLDITRNRLTHKLVIAMVCGVLMIVFACTLIVLTLDTAVLISYYQATLYLAIGLGCSLLGAWLAKKYHHLE